MDYFVFPVNFEDVEQEYQGRHTAQVEQISEGERQILLHLKQIDSTVFRNYEEIRSHEVFNYLYNLIKQFAENIESRPMKVVEKLSETLHSIATIILKACTNIVSGDSMEDLRVSYKMIIFLVLYFVTVVTRSKQKASQVDLIASAINKENRRKKSKGNDVEFSEPVVQNLKMIIELLKESLKIDYKVLWERKEVDQEMLKRYTDVCVKVLESSIAKEEHVINSVFEILEVIIREKAELFINIQRVLINLVYESEMTETLVQFFSRAESPQLQRLCTETIICVVVYLVQKNLNSEASSIKNTKEFLSRLSEKIPKVFYNNLSCFIRLYEHDSYLLRNAISDILMNILRYVLNKETDESMCKARAKFINTLIQRIYDKSSFCRWHVLGILNQLTLERVVPKNYLIMFMKAGVDRIKDHSVNTRKKALQLINTIIEDVWPEGKELNTLKYIEDERKVLQTNLQNARNQCEHIQAELEGLGDEQAEQKGERLQQSLKLLLKTIKEHEAQEIALSEQEEVIKLIEDVLSRVKILLSSKTDTDVLETIRLFIKFYKRNLQCCKECLPSIRLLVFSREKKIKDEVLMTFAQLHLLGRDDREVANELIMLFREAQPQDESALQEILEIIVGESLSKNTTMIKPYVFSCLWADFIKYERSESDVSAKRAILTILRLVYLKDTLMITQECVQSFLNILKKYISLGQPDFHILKEITRIVMVAPGTNRYLEANSRNFLLGIVCVLVKSQESSNQEWYTASQLLLNAIYEISPNPEKVTEIFLKKLHQNLTQKTCSSVSVAHFIYTLSHSCLKLLIHLDSLENKVKSMQTENQEDNSQEPEEELDKVVGGIEAAVETKVNEIQQMAEKILDDPFISRWIRVIETISNNMEYGNELEIIAVLSYCKFMCIKASYCQQHFPNLLRILTKSKIDSVIKNNIIIAIGDLLHRFPNVVEPYSSVLYVNLHDRDPRVRKTTLTVLTHLALNDMIKVKGDICEIAMLFNDEDSEIQGLVKQFFSETNRKDPKYLFNIIPEALNRFSDVERISDEKIFGIFLENVLPLMEKDKYCESLVAKLCERLSNSLNVLELKNTAFCLSELNLNERGLRLLLDNFIDFKKTLDTPEIMTSFRSLVTKLKKSNKGESKSLAEDLENKIMHFNEDMFNADLVKKRNERNQKKQPRRKGQPSKTKPAASTASDSHSRKKQSKRGRRTQLKEEFDEGVESDEQLQSSHQQQVEENAARIIQRIRPHRNAHRRPIIEEDEEGDDFDEYENDE